MTFARVCVCITVCAVLMIGGSILEDLTDSGICITILLAQNGII